MESGDGGAGGADDDNDNDGNHVTVLVKGKPSSFVAGVVVNSDDIGFVGWDDGKPICDTCVGNRRRCVHAAALASWVDGNPGTSRVSGAYRKRLQTAQLLRASVC